MKTITNIVAPSFAGKGKAARSNAFAAIAPLSFDEALSRDKSLANMRVVLGNAPSEAEVKAAKAQWIVGRVASRLPASKVPLVGTPEQRMVRAADLVLHYAKPPTDGKASRPLRAGQKGRRTAIEQRVVRAAEEACSVFFAELGLTTAKTNGERNAAKGKGAAMAGSGKGKGKAAAPSHAQLVKAPAPINAAEYVNHMQSQLASLLAFDNKHAKLRPIMFNEVAEKLAALKQVANKAANDFQVREAAAKK